VCGRTGRICISSRFPHLNMTDLWKNLCQWSSGSPIHRSKSRNVLGPYSDSPSDNPILRIQSVLCGIKSIDVIADGRVAIRRIFRRQTNKFELQQYDLGYRSAVPCLTLFFRYQWCEIKPSRNRRSPKNWLLFKNNKIINQVFFTWNCPIFVILCWNVH
jgi:hypothetical protein